MKARSKTHRILVTAATSAALVLTTAGGCGPTQEAGDDDAPAVTNQQPDGDGDQDEPDDDADDDGPDDDG